MKYYKKEAKRIMSVRRSRVSMGLASCDVLKPPPPGLIAGSVAKGRGLPGEEEVS